jgi:hypothetical protein
MAVKMTMLVLWVAIPCGPADRYQRFGEHIACIFRANALVLFTSSHGVTARKINIEKYVI